MGSLLVHLLAAVLFGTVLSRLFVTPEPDHSAPTEIVTIARRTPPPPTPKPKPVPEPLRAAASAPLAVVPPRPVAPPKPVVVPPRPRTRATPPPSAAPRPVRVVTRPTTPRARAPVATEPPVAAPPSTHVAHVPRGRAHLSNAQIASISRDLATAISNDKAAIDPLHVDHPAPVATAKDYGASYGAFDDVGDGRRGNGLCDPVRDWSADGYDYYYVACTVRYSDGSSGRETVPWPVRFPPGDDPFAGTARHNTPLAMPLPGWHEQTTDHVSDALKAYAADHGVTLQ